MTTNQASNGPALPKIDENATSMASAHLKPPVMVAI